MQNLLDVFPDWVLLGTAIIVGIFALWGILDKSLKERNKEKTSLEDKVRALYQEESKQLQEQVNTMGEQIKRLTTENEVITKIFQGRDNQTVEFQKTGFETMKQFAITNQLVAETHKIAIMNKNGLEKMGKNIEKLVTALEKHLANVRKNTTTTTTTNAEIIVKKTA